MTILFAGGGSLGPVTPLLAVARALRRLEPGVSFAWAGTPQGPERALAEAEGMDFFEVPVAKWPRYPDIRWLTFPRDIYLASRYSQRLIAKIEPDAVVSVGGFTAVPVIRAASKRGIPCFIHQLDVVPTWSNRLIERRCISKTSSFVQTGYEQLPTPVRFQLANAPSREEAARSFGLDPSRPIVLVFGGGQGAQALNDAIHVRLDAWLKRTQLIHVTGRRKMEGLEPRVDYAVCELLDAESMRRAYAAADVVVTRAGIGALSEIASLSKAAVVVPIPKSHQVANAMAFSSAKAALFVTQEQPSFGEILRQQVTDLLHDAHRRTEMGETAHRFFPTDDGSGLAASIVKKIPVSGIRGGDEEASEGARDGSSAR